MEPKQEWWSPGSGSAPAGSFNAGVERLFALPSRVYAFYPGFITLLVLCTLSVFLLADPGQSHEWYGGEALAYRALAEEVIKGDFPPGGPYAGMPAHLPPLYPTLLGLAGRLTGQDPFELIGLASIVGAALLPVVAYFTGKLLFEDWRPAAAGAALVTFGAGFSGAYVGDRSLFTSGHLFAPLTPLDIGLLMIPLGAALFIRAADGDAVGYGRYVGIVAAVIGLTHLQSMIYLIFVLLCLGAAWLVMRPVDWRKALALYLTTSIVGLGLSVWWWGPQLWTGMREGGIFMRTVAASEQVAVGVGSWPSQFGLVLLLALGGSVLAVITARRLRKLAPVMAVAWLVIPLVVGATVGDRLPLAGTLRGDRLALLASFPMALLAGLALTEWRRLLPAVPGVYSFGLTVLVVLVAALPTLGDQRDVSSAQGEPVFGGRVWRAGDALGFALFLRDRANETGTATLVADDPEAAIAWFFAGNKPLAWTTPAFYSIAYNVRETTDLSDADRVKAQAEALSGSWAALERIANRDDVRYAVLSSLEDGRLGLSVATAKYLATLSDQRGEEVRLELTDDGLGYLAMTENGSFSYRVDSAAETDTPFIVRLRAEQPGVLLEIRSGPSTVEVDVTEEDLGQWVEIPIVLPLVEGENAVEVTATGPVDLAAIYAYTESLDTIPPSYRVRFDDGVTVVLEIPRL